MGLDAVGAELYCTFVFLFRASEVPIVGRFYRRQRNVCVTLRRVELECPKRILLNFRVSVLRRHCAVCRRTSVGKSKAQASKSVFRIDRDRLFIQLDTFGRSSGRSLLSVIFGL